MRGLGGPAIESGVPAELNDRFYPILLSRMDDPVTSAEAEAYFEKLIVLADEGIRSGRKYTVITTSNIMKFTAASRKHVADAQARYLSADRNDVTLAAFLPIDNSVIRGMMTAFRWVAPRLLQYVHVVPSLEAALDDALRALADNGTPFKGDLQALRRVLDLER